MAEVWFYHLENKPVEQELPGLLQRGLERDLSMAVFLPDDASVKSLSDQLWACADVAFIPHGLSGEPDSATQPILLCTSGAPTNRARYAFYVAGALPEDVTGFDRASVMFDGRSEGHVQQARSLWKRLKAEGIAIKYWKQDESGRWRDMAVT